MRRTAFRALWRLLRTRVVRIDGGMTQEQQAIAGRA
jgi:hypothetical protein